MELKGRHAEYRPRGASARNLGLFGDVRVNFGHRPVSILGELGPRTNKLSSHEVRDSS